MTITKIGALHLGTWYLVVASDVYLYKESMIPKEKFRKENMILLPVDSGLNVINSRKRNTHTSLQ